MKMKRVAAWMLSAAMLFSCMPDYVAYAAEDRKNEAAASAEPELNQESEGGEPLLQYIYMTPLEYAEEEGQVIIASLNVEGRKIEAAALTYQDGEGSLMILEAGELASDYVMFELEDTGIEEAALTALNLTVDGQAYSLDLASIRREWDTESEESSASELEEGELYALDDGMDGEPAGSVMAAGSKDISEIRQQAKEQIAVLSRTLSDQSVSGKTAKSGDIIIVLDPGHGGSDSGACRTWDGVSYIEKDIALKISKATKKELESYEGVQVYMTRTDDRAVGLEARVKYASDLGADCIISQHINSTVKDKDTVTGAMVMVSYGNYRKAVAQESWNIANTILGELANNGLKNLGLLKNLSETGNKYPNGKLADYYAIVRHSILYNLPGMIVEHGFVNNPSDCKKYYGSNAKIAALGTADGKALAKYYGLKKKDGNGDANGGPDDPAEPVYGWMQENGQWYYLNTDGTRKKGFEIIDGNVYYFNSKGYRLTGWHDLEISRYYFKSNGVMAKGVLRIDGKYYFFNSKGWLRKGWFMAGGKRYYSNAKGQLYKGWKKHGNKWYYFDKKTRAALTGMQQIDRKYYYFGPKGVMQTGWQNIGSARYYFDSDGIRRTGWLQSSGKWYYLNRSNGKMLKKKWVKDKKKWYYLSKSGQMVSGKHKTIKGRKYRFTTSGACTNKKK